MFANQINRRIIKKTSKNEWNGVLQKKCGIKIYKIISKLHFNINPMGFNVVLNVFLDRNLHLRLKHQSAG